MNPEHQEAQHDPNCNERKSVVIIGLDPCLINFLSPDFAAFPGLTAEKVLTGITLAEEGLFVGFHEDLQKDAKKSVIKTLDIAVKFRENNSLSLVPIIRDLTTKIEWIEFILSKTSIKQMKNALEYRKTVMIVNRQTKSTHTNSV